MIKLQSLLTLNLLAATAIALAQDAVPTPSTTEPPAGTPSAVAPVPPSQDAPEPAAPAEPPVPAVTTPVFQVPPSAPANTTPEDKTTIWRLEGGGEIVGELVKDTPTEVYIDIGPQIINIPASSILSKSLLSELQSAPADPAGVGSGVYDSQTGSLIFHSREGAGRVQSQQEILDDVKRSVVLVSNPAGLGTGWIIDNDGRLVTNHHVVGNESYQTVTLFVKNGNQWDKKKIDNCSVVSFSTLLDIAIVQLDMTQVRDEGITLYPIKIAPSDSLESGDVVYAVGNPGMGRMVLDHTISQGIVSSLARNFNDVIYLQTTAAVNPGNSGGPLVNERGEVVGLVTLKAIFQEGVAFALPVDYIHQFLKNSQAFALSDANRNKGYRYLPPE
ncbi:trypsin-like peptidase domain-containing protein [Candidatus Sumerlaeota bacterium]|nr:trypsin-like peptidase domain-containing protein [Candidatus Sumerlaeota bacterium]